MRRWSTSVIQQLHDCLSDREGRGHSQTNSQIIQLILALSLLEYTVKIMEHEYKNKQKNGRKELKHVSAIHIERNVDWGGGSKRELNLC